MPPAPLSGPLGLPKDGPVYIFGWNTRPSLSFFFLSFSSSPVCFSVYFFGSAFCLVSVTHGSSAFAASVALVLILLRMMFCFLSDDVFLHIMVFFCFVDGMMASARLCCTSSSSDLRCSCRSRICHNRFTMLRSWSYGFPLKNLQRDG